jgi:hypothetical protein
MDDSIKKKMNDTDEKIEEIRLMNQYAQKSIPEKFIKKLSK